MAHATTAAPGAASTGKTPQRANTNNAGKAKRNSKPPVTAVGKGKNELGRKFAYWQEVERRLERTTEAVKSWHERLGTSDPHKKTVGDLLAELQLETVASAETRKLFVRLNDKGFKPPTGNGAGAWVPGLMAKYKPDVLKKYIDMGADVEAWSGTWKVSQVFRNASGTVMLMLINTKDKTGVGPTASYNFTRA